MSTEDQRKLSVWDVYFYNETKHLGYCQTLKVEIYIHSLSDVHPTQYILFIGIMLDYIQNKLVGGIRKVHSQSHSFQN